MHAPSLYQQLEAVHRGGGVDVESAKIEPTIPRGTTASLAGNPTILVSRIVLNYIN